MRQQQIDQHHFRIVCIKCLLNRISIHSFDKRTTPKCCGTHGLQLAPQLLRLRRIGLRLSFHVCRASLPTSCRGLYEQDDQRALRIVAVQCTRQFLAADVLCGCALVQRPHPQQPEVLLASAQRARGDERNESLPRIASVQRRDDIRIGNPFSLGSSLQLAQPQPPQLRREVRRGLTIRGGTTPCSL